MDAFAVILDRDFEDGDFDVFVLECGANFDLRLGRAVLDGVEEEVGEDEGAVFRSEGDGARMGRELVDDDADLTKSGDRFELGDGGGDAVVQIPTSLRDVGRPSHVGQPIGCAFEAGEGEHFCDEVFDAFGVGEGSLVAGLIFVGRAGAHAGELQRRFDDSDGGFEFVCSVGDEGALLVEGALESLEYAFEGVGEGGELGGFASGGGGMKGE